MWHVILVTHTEHKGVKGLLGAAARDAEGQTHMWYKDSRMCVKIYISYVEIK